MRKKQDMKQQEKVTNEKEKQKAAKKDQISAANVHPDELQKEADKVRTRKPGSQSNSSKQHNNGRGGGK